MITIIPRSTRTARIAAGNRGSAMFIPTYGEHGQRQEDRRHHVTPHDLIEAIDTEVR